MKTRDSGMPGEGQWSGFFAPDAILCALGLNQVDGALVDIGCGYGTFSLAAARMTGQRVIALDIDPGLVRLVAERARAQSLTLVDARVADVAAAGTGLDDGAAAAVLLFNLLHCEEPLRLLAEARRVLAPGGRVAVIHWRSDIATPRGPDLAIRPRPETCAAWLELAGFVVAVPPLLLPPYHFGLVGRRPRATRSPRL